MFPDRGWSKMICVLLVTGGFSGRDEHTPPSSEIGDEVMKVVGAQEPPETSRNYE